VSFAAKFREKAEQYKGLGEEAPSLVMRAWYESLHRSYVLLAEKEDRYYSQPVLPLVDAGSTQPSAHDLQTIEELEADLALLAARHREHVDEIRADDAPVLSDS
jgi:hypothetical protein